MPLLFSYGTLRLPAVQHELFGRDVSEISDALVGFRLTKVAIDDARVVRLSGAAEHPILHMSGLQSDRVEGAVLELTESELAMADQYETSLYQRIVVETANGRQAFVYVAAAGEL